MKILKRAIFLFLAFLAPAAMAGLVITFDSGHPDETFTVSISGTYSNGAAINFNPSVFCTALFAPLAGGRTQCTFSAALGLNAFPVINYDGAVNLLEPAGEPNRGGPRDVSDTYEVHVRSGNCIVAGVVGSCFAGIIIGTTDLNGSLPPIPGGGNVVETGGFQDITNDFQDDQGNPAPLPQFLAPPTAALPNDLVPLRIIVRSDVVPEPGTLLLLSAGMLALAASKRRYRAHA